MCMHDMQVPTTTYKLYIYKLNACNHLHVIHVLYCYIYKLNACPTTTYNFIKLQR